MGLPLFCCCVRIQINYDIKHTFFFGRSGIAKVVQQELSDSSAQLETGRIADYVEITVPRYSDPMFHIHFRMNRTSVKALTLLIMYFKILFILFLETYVLICFVLICNTFKIFKTLILKGVTPHTSIQTD